jgi:hypothetical protein
VANVEYGRGHVARISRDQQGRLLNAVLEHMSRTLTRTVILVGAESCDYLLTLNIMPTLFSFPDRYFMAVAESLISLYDKEPIPLMQGAVGMGNDEEEALRALIAQIDRFLGLRSA